MSAEISTKVIEVIKRSYNVKSFRVEPAKDTGFKAGQFLQVTLNNDQKLKRYLSISSSPTEACYLEFTKKMTQSDFSVALGNLKMGDELKIQYPFGKFTLEDNPAEKIAFLSGGIGITPIRSICKCALDKKLEIDIVLIYANQSVRDIIFHDDLEQMQKAYPNFKLAHVLCEPAPDFKCAVGLINKQTIRNEIPDYKERKFFLCGPPGMVEAMRRILSEEVSVDREQIVMENFQGY